MALGMRLSDQKSKIMLQMDYEPEGALETIGDTVGAVSLRVASPAYPGEVRKDEGEIFLRMRA